MAGKGDKDTRSDLTKRYQSTTFDKTIKDWCVEYDIRFKDPCCLILSGNHYELTDKLDRFTFRMLMKDNKHT